MPESQLSTAAANSLPEAFSLAFEELATQLSMPEDLESLTTDQVEGLRTEPILDGRKDVPFKVRLDDTGRLPTQEVWKGPTFGVTVRISFTIDSPVGTFPSIIVESRAGGDLITRREWKNVEAGERTEEKKFSTDFFRDTHFKVKGDGGTEHRDQTVAGVVYVHY